MAVDNDILYMMNDSTLYRIDGATGIANTVTVAGIAGSFGAAWSDRPDELYVSANATGNISKISGFTGNAPAWVQVTSGIVTSNNDGAACKEADSPFNLPTANDDAYPVTANSTKSVSAAAGVLARVVGTGFTVAMTTAASHGTVSLASDGSFLYVPNTGFVGTDTFTYIATDQFGCASAAPATVTLTVSLPAAPVASADSYLVAGGTTLSQTGAGVLSNDSGQLSSGCSLESSGALLARYRL